LPPRKTRRLHHLHGDIKRVVWMTREERLLSVTVTETAKATEEEEVGWP
jgi:hypothetical protein